MGSNRSILRLVHSKSPIEPSEKGSTKHVQMDLFTQPEKKNSIVYVQPHEAEFEELFSFIDSIGAHHVVDIREAPFLSFYGTSREDFFAALSSRKISYYSVYAVMLANSLHSMVDFFESISGNSPNNNKKFHTEMNSIISSGPSIVFTDNLPASDISARHFTFLLHDLSIDHSPQYLDAIPPLLKQM